MVFDDRIEIRSYGRLPTGITVEQLSGKHDSKPVNPLIAGAFHRTGAVEVWGRGTNRVIAMCKKHGSAPPTFEERSGFLAVTFKAQKVPDDASADKEAVEKTREKIITAIRGNPAITTTQLAELTALTPKGIEWNLKRLRTESVIRRVGPDKGGQWEVMK